ncbi:MAG: ribose-phosphate pyrophosphokinase [Oscillospiraceae bacterium]|nr:ribose-phosphate pyrophosphokinase [Oscillospiraceae bacterium]
MLKLNGKPVKLDHFPDGTLLIKEEISGDRLIQKIKWKFESNEEMVALMFLVEHLREHGAEFVELEMPYIPNARQDRTKKNEDVFTLKYFAKFINALWFSSVTVLDPHSAVSEALIDRLTVCSPGKFIRKVLDKIGTDDLIMFFPDEGAMKRYASECTELPYAFGIKRRNWSTGKIEGLDAAGCTELISGKRVLIIDDICSKGGTFYHSAKKLKELGAAEVYLYVSHCENTILDGELLTCGMIEKVYTTDSLFTKEHPKVEVLYDE